MATEPDPHRTLGLAPTASLAEVKAAYRRLAKANHPDAAGEGALPRFLAIQAAYERLVGPAPGRKSSSDAAAAPKKPWEADPERRDATYRAYGGRSRRPAGEPGSRSARGAKPGGPSKAKGSRPSADPASSETAGGGRSGRPKKATLGSTSYDGVDRESFEPDWGGASWYGTTSGTYWTINPKEYADPRKHGPEYLARARRKAGAGAIGDAAEGPATGPATTLGGPSSKGPDPEATAPRHTTASWWESTSGAAAAARDAKPEAPPARPSTRASDQASDQPSAQPSAPPRPGPNPPPEPVRTDRHPASSPSAWSQVRRALVDGPPPSTGWRVARALIAWAPIGLAIGWASGELTGCGRFAATCDPGTAPAVWVVQALVLLLLLALPSIAGWAVVAAGVCLAVAVPTTLLVTASAGASASQTGAAFLGAVLAIAWLVGLAAAVLMGRPSSRGPTGPVS